MSENKLGRDPAYPVVKHDFISYNGMNRRFYAACAAMQGVIANEGIYTNPEIISQTIHTCYQYIDELLRQENEQKI